MFLIYWISDKGKPTERWRRKVSGLSKRQASTTAGPPESSLAFRLPRCAFVTSWVREVERMSRAILGVLLCLLAGVLAPARAEDAYRQQMKGLDEQVQEVKSDVLSIAAELNQLQERLLYPSDTHLAIFVELAKGDTLRLDAVQIQIDGQLVANYLYSFKELEALQKGGVQRIHTGNVTTGEHDIQISLNGKLANGKDYTHSEHFAFSKAVKPKLMGVTLAGPDSGQPAIKIGDW
jgi:hypothetical protein